MHFARPVRSVPLALIAGAGHYDSVIGAVRRATRSVWIATANIKELLVQDERPRLRRRRRERDRYCSVLEVLDGLAGAGVELRILHAELPSRPFRAEFDRHPRLVAGGAELRLCPRVHLKMVIIDGERAYLGSANWTGAGLGAKHADRRNFELGLMTEDEGVLDEVQALYDRIWRGAECRACRVRDRCAAPLDLG